MLRAFLAGLAMMALAFHGAEAVRAQSARAPTNPCANFKGPSARTPQVHSYVATVHAQIIRQAIEPFTPLPLGGVCIEFSVRPNGSIASKRVVKSGGTILNAAAL